MGDREIPQFNRVIFAKWGDRTQKLHLQRLAGEIKPVVDMTPPPAFSHLSTRSKVKQRWSDEQAKIEYENMLLLQKMRAIMSEPQNPQFLPTSSLGSAQGGQASVLLGGAGEGNKGSLNRGERLREMKRILADNASLLHRIQSRGSVYHVQDWEKDHVLKEKQLASMGRYPYVSSTLPASTMAELARNRPIKRYGTIRFPLPRGEHGSPMARSPKAQEEGDESKASDSPPAAAALEVAPLDVAAERVSTPLSKPSPRRVHHLPPKDVVPAAAAAPSSAPKKKSKRVVLQAPEVEPIALHLTVEHFAPLLASGSKGDKPRVVVFLRRTAGVGYERLGVVDVASEGEGAQARFVGTTSVPGIAPDAPGGEDHRVRVALFRPSASSSSTPSEQDDGEMLSEARFSLPHLLGYQREVYKLKLLRHGLPVAGQGFEGQGLAPGEVEARKGMVEPILEIKKGNGPHKTKEEEKSSSSSTSSSVVSPALKPPVPKASPARAPVATGQEKKKESKEVKDREKKGVAPAAAATAVAPSASAPAAAAVVASPTPTPVPAAAEPVPAPKPKKPVVLKAYPPSASAMDEVRMLAEGTGEVKPKIVESKPAEKVAESKVVETKSTPLSKPQASPATKSSPAGPVASSSTTPKLLAQKTLSLSSKTLARSSSLSKRSPFLGSSSPSKVLAKVELDNEFIKATTAEEIEAQTKAATLIQSLHRGRTVRRRREALFQERRLAQAERLSLEEQRDDQAAKDKREEAEATKLREAEEAELKRQKKAADDAAAVAARRASVDLAALRKAQEAELAKRTAPSDAERKAEDEKKRLELESKKKAAAEARAAEDAARLAKEAALASKLASIEKSLQSKVITMSLTVQCKALPGGKSVSPMVALYSQPSGPGVTGKEFSFVSQTERLDHTANPRFLEPLEVVMQGGEVMQYMASVYNVRDEDDIQPSDVLGTALLGSGDLLALVVRQEGGQKFEALTLGIIQEGQPIPGASMVITEMSYKIAASTTATAAAATSVAKSASSSSLAASSSTSSLVPDGQVAIYVSIKNILLPAGVATCYPLVALYVKDHASTNFNYSAQLESASGTSVSFAAPLFLPKPVAGKDTDCMINCYNHDPSQGDDISDSNSLGASLFSLNKLLASSKGAISVALVKAGQISGQMILKTRPDASSANVSRPTTATVQQLSAYDLTVSCANLPRRPNHATCDPMVALYGQNPTTQQFVYCGQTEKATNTANPKFDAKIRLDEHAGGGPDGDRALMLMIYDVADEDNIQESDQICTASLTWKFLRDQAQAQRQRVTLPLINSAGQQHATATITIVVQKVA